MSLVFLSHSSANNAQALAVAQWLEANGWANYFLDISETRGLLAGSRWQEALKNASHRCEAVIFLVSTAWVDSKWCVAEFLLAKQLGKKIFGVIVEEIPIEDLPHELTNEWQLCDLVKGKTQIEFNVEREPIVPPTRIELSEAGLNALKQGLRNAGLEASAFPWPPENEPERAPYRGLKPYEAQDAAIFFGRDAAIVRGLDQVRQLRDNGLDRMLVILGASGAGKSSFMRAGLWPRLARDDHHFYALPVVRPARAAINGEEGLVSCLVKALADVGVSPISRGEIRIRFQSDDVGEVLLDYLQRLRDALVAGSPADIPEPTLILPIDQGEELYAGDGAEESAQLRAQLACFGQVAGDPAGRQGPNLLLLVTIRTDLYQLMQDDRLLRDIGRQMIDLTPMDRAEYKLVIEGPAVRASEAGNGLVVEPSLSEQLINDTHGADALPMLAFTLERLYTDYGADGDLTLEDYQRLGGVTGSLSAAIDAAMEIPQNAPVIPGDRVVQHRLLKQAFIPWLAEVDEQSGERRRRVAAWDELPVETHPVLERLTRARLLVRDLRTTVDGGDRREVIEVAHEALLRRWPALVDWLDADQDALKAIGSVARAARQWEQNGQDDEYLVHSGERLRYAENLLEREDFAQRLQASGRDYLGRCRHAEDARTQSERRQQRRLRVALVSSVLLTILALAAAVMSYISSQEAAIAKNIAENNEKRAIAGEERAQRTVTLMLATFSRQQTDAGFASRGVLLALEALSKSMNNPDRPHVREAEVALHGALTALRGRRSFEFEGHVGGVLSAEFSPDGSRVVTASQDRTARLWDAVSGEELAVFRGHTDDVNSANFNPDGSRVVTASEDKTARLWGAAKGNELAVFKGHTDDVMSAEFSLDGSRVVTASKDKTARLWDVASGEGLAVFKGHASDVISAKLSPDGSQVLTASRDNTARLWDAASGKELAVFKGHASNVISAEFSPDGSRVLMASGDKATHQWDAASGEELAGFDGHTAGVISAKFSLDGSGVVTASVDRTARVWDASNGVELVVFKTGRIRSADFSPDGSRVVTVSLGDGAASLWDASSGEKIAVFRDHRRELISARFSPDGSHVLTASKDGTARVWDTAIVEELAFFKGHRGPVIYAEFSPDGSRVVTASEDYSARLWDAMSGEELVDFRGHAGWVFHAAFSPDGSLVLTGSEDKTARLWDAASGKELAVFKGHADGASSNSFNSFTNSDGTRIKIPDGVWSAKFNREGSRVVTASGDRTARVWDVASGEELTVLNGHTDAVRSAEFSPDGSTVITASMDKTVRLWDVVSGMELTVFEGHTDGVRYAGFSPDGAQLVTAAGDRTARLWDVASGKELAVFKGHTDTVFSAQFNYDGSRVVTASGDKSVRLWDAESGEELAVFKGHTDQVMSARFSPDGSRVVTASRDKTASLWEILDTQALIDRARKWVPRKELTRSEKERFVILSE